MGMKMWLQGASGGIVSFIWASAQEGLLGLLWNVLQRHLLSHDYFHNFITVRMEAKHRPFLCFRLKRCTWMCNLPHTGLPLVGWLYARTLCCGWTRDGDQ
jgi:hypothetical protein